MNLQHSPVEEIRKDIYGNKYYVFKDPRQISPQRAIAAMGLVRFADMRITRNRLNNILDEMEKQFNAGQFMKAGALIEEIRISEQLWAEPETLRELATVYVMIDGESPLTYDPHVNQKKKEMWAADTETEAFFLYYAFKFTESYSKNSGNDLQEYFEKTKELLKRNSRYTAINTYR